MRTIAELTPHFPQKRHSHNVLLSLTSKSPPNQKKPVKMQIDGFFNICSKSVFEIKHKGTHESISTPD